ncbi:DgyrCDS7031 [Dimorphilus gyrociliatus]|uniref:DgyrCDS7031 n=1 Tax=Dimorphilus gyrociliatus TaxID=2664684 RepID=A0A7I8VUS6_9ANNE|nr:DgyrCDS7031 [Dimorphilus gyrociliatus]
MSVIKFYHSFISPPSRNVFFTFKALDIPFEVHSIDLLGNETKSEEFRKINPHGLVPTIVDNGFALWESRAIITYLFDRYARPEFEHFYPKDLKKRAVIDRLLYFDATTFYPAVLAIIEAIAFKKRKPTEDEFNSLYDCLEKIERIYLKDSTYFTGSKTTLADIAFAASLTALEPFGVEYSRYEGIDRFIKFIKQTDWFKSEGSDYENFSETFSKEMRDKGLI